MNKRRLLAVDPSLRSTGWALFECDTARPLSWGLVRPVGTRFLLAERLKRLQDEVSELFLSLQLSSADFLVCEGPAHLVLNPQSALKVEHVRGIFETLARGIGMNVPGRVNPRTVQSEVLGIRGKQPARETVKAWARESAVRLYGEEIERTGSTRDGISQDIIDALLIGTLAVSKIRLAAQTGVNLPDIFAAGRGGRGRNHTFRSRAAYRC